ncbi:MAG: hypothetical protein M1817_000421 [Caeruleum heppii]|nr:MAG: hypothetical protein M1817_000421 [Caeruleum heppii]
MAQLRVKPGTKSYGQQSSTLRPGQGRRGIQRKQPSRQSDCLREKQLKNKQAHRSPSDSSQSPDIEPTRDQSFLAGSPNSARKRKRSVQHQQARPQKTEHPTCQDDDRPDQKRLRTSSVGQLGQGPVGNINNNFDLHHWIRAGTWPQEYSEQGSNMIQQLTRKRSTPSLLRKRSSPSVDSDRQSDTTSVPFREGKNPLVRSRYYESTLEDVGIQMGKQELPPLESCKALCHTLLGAECSVPEDTLFQDDLFETTCDKIRNRNEARVIEDVARLIVPSAETLTTYGATHLKDLIVNLNESWSHCIPLVSGPRPQPDFSVGFRRSAFTSDQLNKLRPHIGDWSTASRLVATFNMYFPFLTSEVKCGNEALNIADRQNAHSASVAINAVVELYRAVARQDELHRKILAFSISHDNETVRIYGHFVLIDGKDTSFYRHSIKKFDFTSEDGKEKWTAYKFTRNVYDTFVPIHLKRICSAVDQLPDPDVFLVKPLPSVSIVESAEQDDSQATPCSQENVSGPSSQTTEPVFKKPKAIGSKD